MASVAPSSADRESRNAFVAVIKAALFLVIVLTFQWLAYGPLRVRWQKPVNDAFKPVFGEYAGYSFLAYCAEAALCLILTWAAMRFVEARAFLDVGLHWTKAGRRGFWYGALVGFLPGLAVVLLGVLVLSAQASAYFTMFFFAMLIGIIYSSLAHGGYPLQVMLRLLPVGFAVAVVTILSQAPSVVLYTQQGWRQGSELYLIQSILSCIVVCLSYWRFGNLWGVAGATFGSYMVPHLGNLRLDRWFEHSGLITYEITIPQLLGIVGTILLLCLLPIRRENSWAFLQLQTTEAYPEARLSKEFYTAAWAIGVGIAVAMAISLSLQTLRGHVYRFEIDQEIVSVTIPLIISGIVFLILIHKMWAAINDRQANVTPGTAVGFLFIPFFGIYWAFRVIPGYVTAYNEYLNRHKLNVPRLESGIFIAYVVLAFITWIPIVGIVALAADYIIGLIMIAKICDAVNALGQRSQLSSQGMADPVASALAPE